MSRIAVMLTIFCLATRAFALDITAPGVTVPTGDTGIVMNDLTCGPLQSGVVLATGATLNLNGHVLDGCAVTAAAPAPKLTKATVVGPGEIRNAGISITAGTLRVRNVVITDATDVGILGSGDFAAGPSTLKLTGVTVTGSASDGVRGSKVKARDVTSSGNAGAGIVGWVGVSGTAVVTSDNGHEGVFCSAGKLSLTNSQVTGNALGGVGGVSVALARSTSTDNDAGGGSDLVASKPPHVRHSTCGTSLKADQTATWGVCTND